LKKSNWRVACSGITLVSGLTADVNAYRAELHGIHMALMAIKAICTFFGITQEGSIDVYCDRL